MANVKQIQIEGQIPFNYYEDQDLASRFSFMQSPTAGIEVVFAKRETYVANAQGGRTAMFGFEISGQEALGFGWIEALVASIKRVGGSVDTNLVSDLEA